MKKRDYISWDQYFMGVAKLSAMRSKDPNTQVGACIVNDKNRIVGIGYNGFPIGIDDDCYPWESDGAYLDTKYPYVVHAEPNAILNSTVSLENATLYVTLFPCNECAKLIIQSGIKEIVFEENKYHHEDSVKASMRMLKDANVTLRQLNPIKVSISND
ncbi:MAG: deoxycytidylate deaminase [Candidatus Izemoplasmataceae bacterium]